MSDQTVLCPEWEYEKFDGWRTLLEQRTRQILVWIRNALPVELLQRCCDTRPYHEAYFEMLTPPQCTYYRGHYRGENYLCLRDYNVQIKSDPLVGSPPHLVLDHLRIFIADLRDASHQMDLIKAAPRALLKSAEKLYLLVGRVAAVFVYFLQIHPYANGNGHMGRLILHALLACYGIFPSRFKIHPRPGDPDYSQSIKNYRRESRRDLEVLILRCL